MSLAIEPDDSTLRIHELSGLTKVRHLRDCVTEPVHSDLGTLLEQEGNQSGDAIGVYLISRGEAVTACIPRIDRRIPMPVRFGEKVLWKPTLPGVLILPASQERLSDEHQAKALINWLAQRKPRIAVAFTDLMTDTSLYRAVIEGNSSRFRLANNQPSKHLFHRFDESYEAFFEGRKSKYKNQIRKKEKVFQDRTRGQARLVEYRQAGEVAAFLDAAQNINRLTYQFKLFGETIDNDPNALTRYKKLAETGRFRSFILWHGASPVCFVLGTQEGRSIFNHIKTGFDPAWQDCAPGINTNILLLKRLYEHDRPSVLDFGSGDADYKRLFANEARMSASPILIPRCLSHASIFGLHWSSVKLTEAIAQVLERLGIKQRVKKFFRQGSLQEQ